MGTASDRYAGWVGRIYSEERYTGRVQLPFTESGWEFPGYVEVKKEGPPEGKNLDGSLIIY